MNDTACEVAPAGQVRQEVNGYKQLCQTLCNAIGELDNRLISVLKEKIPETENNVKVKQDTSDFVELALSVRRENEAFGGALEALQSILSRLEL